MPEVREKILLGTSGWSYKEWVGPFYTEADKSMLKAYTKVFKTVEIDSTFYRYPSKGTVIGWTRYSPEGFIYSAKLPRLITHEKKLDMTLGIEEDLNQFMELLEPLHTSGKLGCLLIQLPPRFRYNLAGLEDFFKVLPTYVKFAVEFRDLSWMREETWPLLEKYGVTYTIVDEPLLPPETHFTSDIAYFRWHGKGTKPWFNYHYKPEELEPWVPKVKEAAAKAKTVFGYMNNHFHGYAVENCLQILEMLGALTPQQMEAKKRAENYFKAATAYKESTLEAFFEPAKGSVPTMSIESLLRHFLDERRLRRAREILDSEVRIDTVTPARVEASVRGYRVIIDLSDKSVAHDCADWTKSVSGGRFCKHIAKLFLSMDKEKATALLIQINKEREVWRFKPLT